MQTTMEMKNDVIAEAAAGGAEPIPANGVSRLTAETMLDRQRRRLVGWAWHSAASAVLGIVRGAGNGAQLERFEKLVGANAVLMEVQRTVESMLPAGEKIDPTKSEFSENELCLLNALKLLHDREFVDPNAESEIVVAVLQFAEKVATEPRPAVESANVGE